jgi:hypothetical protein
MSTCACNIFMISNYPRTQFLDPFMTPLKKKSFLQSRSGNHKKYYNQKRIRQHFFAHVRLSMIDEACFLQSYML